MVDELTRYYMRKQNLQAQDEFHEQILPTDMDELNKASVYMVMAPIVTSAMIYGYSLVRESGGASGHFAHAIAAAREKFVPTTWGSSSAA